MRPGDLLSGLLARTRDDRLHIVPQLVSSDPTCPLKSAVLAPMIVQGKRAGTLIAFYRSTGRPSHAELRVVQEAASLVSAQVELSVLAEQEERLAQAELRALRAQISPHFIYNALAAVAGDIHARPEEARELLIDFAEFTRYLFRDGRSYVTLGEELDHVRALSAAGAGPLPRQPARHDRRPRGRPAAPSCRRCRCSRWSRTPSATASSCAPAAAACRSPRAMIGGDVELRVSDDGVGIEPERVPAVLAGAGGGIGLSNVDARLRATFGDRYALRIESQVGEGTTAVMTVPNLRGESAPRQLAELA